MKRIACVIAALALLGSTGAAWAQSEDDADRAPEVLTSELALKTLLESEQLEVNFVIVDSDTITAVSINGEPQTIEPGDTVLITREFRFTDDVTNVTVQATDEAGNTRTVTYAVYAPGVDPAQRAQQKDKLTVFFNYDVRLELDDNPSNDLSSPVDIEGVELVGVVPDSEQDDTRTNVLVSGGVSKGLWTVYGGATDIRYSDDANERFNVQALFLGGALRFAAGGDDRFVLGYTFTDINLGEFDYVQTHTVSPGYRSASKDEDGTANTLYGLDVINKSFAKSDIQEDTTVFTLKADRSSLDADKLDRFRGALYGGTASEGIEDSEFNYIAFDMDWMNRWSWGLLFDIGWGAQYRDYPNEEPLSTETFLGDTRTDAPLRFSTGFGYQLMPEFRVMANYQYTFNLSNKSPYERQIFGISLNGAF